MNMLCIFKQYASWRVSSNNGTWSIVHEVSPVYKPEQVEDWRSVGHLQVAIVEAALKEAEIGRHWSGSG